MKAEIERNKDALTENNKYKDFLLSLIPDEFKKQRQDDIRIKRDKLRREWIKQVKKDKSQDHIIFQDDEEIHENIKASFSFMKEANATQTGGYGSKDRKNQTQKDERASITDAEWERRFDELMSLHLVDVPEDYYDDELFFKSPGELDSIFNKLEEENLFSISQLQETELQLELLQKEEEKEREILETKFNTQNKIKIDLENRIREANINLLLAQKKTTGDFLYDPPDAEAGGKKNEAKAADNKKREPIDYEKMLRVVTQQIVEIHKANITKGDVQGKSPIVLLDVSISISKLTQLSVCRKSSKPSSEIWLMCPRGGLRILSPCIRRKSVQERTGRLREPSSVWRKRRESIVSRNRSKSSRRIRSSSSQLDRRWRGRRRPRSKENRKRRKKIQRSLLLLSTWEILRNSLRLPKKRPINAEMH